MTTFTFIPQQSSLSVETRAKGMLAKLAHDLSIEAHAIEATCTFDAGRATVELTIPTAELRVRGVRKGESVDTNTLSASDKTEIERKIRSEVISAARVVAKLEAPVVLEPGHASVEARGVVEVGRSSAKVASKLEVDVAEAVVTASGRVQLNLPALGITPPKGPLGAFRVDDTVEVVFRLQFSRNAG